MAQKCYIEASARFPRNSSEISHHPLSRNGWAAAHEAIESFKERGGEATLVCGDNWIRLYTCRPGEPCTIELNYGAPWPDEVLAGASKRGRKRKRRTRR